MKSKNVKYNIHLRIITYTIIYLLINGHGPLNLAKDNKTKSKKR